MSAPIYKLGRWNLRDIVPEARGAAFEKMVGDLQSQVAEFENERVKLADDISANEFARILKQFESINVTARRLGAYASLWFSEDTQSAEAMTFLGQMRQLLAELSNRTLFFTLWWKALDEATVAPLLASAGDVQYFLESERRFKPHTLTESAEQIINTKDVNGIEGIITLYDTLTNRYEFTLTLKGKKKKMTRGELQTYFRDPSPTLRAAAFRELYRVYAEQGNVLAQIYTYRAQDWAAEQIDLRHFTSPLAVRNLMNDVPDAAVETLLQVCRDNASLFQRYFKSKAKWLGLRKLRRYDIYAPLAPANKKYTYARAVEMVLDSYTAFSPQVADLVRRVLTEQHVDSQVRPGKRGGAFCMSVEPNIAPYVLLNFAGDARDVSTMAHEFGHAIHALLARDHSVLTFHSALPLAETASVFGEMIMTDRLLKNETNVSVRRNLLAATLDDAYATILRQAYFILFEREAHALIAQGKPVDALCAAYLQNLREQFGAAVEVSDEFKWEWVSIPHIFHTPFYTYAYSFGSLLTLALYKQYLAQGEAFKPRYLKILAYGGSASPTQILSEAGIDITAKEFWQGGFEVIQEWVDELEALPAPKRAKPRVANKAVSKRK